MTLFPRRSAIAIALMGAIITGDATASADDLPDFYNFETGPMYRGHLARALIVSAADRDYHTRLTLASREAPNFASHYHLVYWGCGTSCVMGAIIDSISGRVIFLPFSVCCYAGVTDTEGWEPIDFRKDSRLIIFRGLRSEEGINGDHYYKFDDDGFHLITSVEVKADPPAPIPAEPPATPPADELKTCQKIGDDGARLKCYDAVLGFKR